MEYAGISHAYYQITTSWGKKGSRKHSKEIDPSIYSIQEIKFNTTLHMHTQVRKGD